MSLRVGIIGCGYFAQFHLDAWARLPVQVVAICDADMARAEAAAAAFPGARAFTDARDMLDGLALDLVDIVTPPHTHAALVAHCVARGIPAICQKPLAPDWATAQSIVATVERAGATLIIHENFRFMPWFAEASRLIEAGAIGEPLDISFRLRSGDGQGPDAYLARQPYFRRMPRFLVHETVIHLIDVFRSLFGEVTGVFARLRTLNPAILGEDAATVMFAFADARRSGIVDGNRLLDHPSNEPRMTNGVLLVEGTGGQLRLDGYGRLFLRPHGGTEAEHAYAWEPRGYGGDCVFRQTEAALAHVTQGAPVPNTARAWLRNMEIEEAIYRSAAERRFIDV